MTNATYRSMGFCFLSLSIIFALWITRIPEVKSTLNLTDGQLGTALFFLPLGAILSMVLITNVIRRIGEGKSSIIALLVYSCFMILPLLASSYIFLCISLCLVGFAMGWVDISINAVANTLEKINNVKIMATSHGFFSLGGIIGGVAGGLLAENAVPASYQMIAGFIAIALLVVFSISPHIRMIRDITNSDNTIVFAFPTRPLLGLSVIAFCIMMSEGAITDWSTVYLSHNLQTSAAMAGFGFAVFSGMMTLGRFNGDYFTTRWGHSKVLMTGLTLSLAGLALLLIPNVIAALIGFGLVGLGYSSVIPIVFSQSSQKNHPHLVLPL